jgi:uncharacterized iron-regulated membrane protein
MRYLILIHRYLGIGVGVLMVVWCLTGVVMMYVHYPALSPAERLRHLEPLEWRGCCVVSESSLADAALVDTFQVESVISRPVLRVKLAHGGWRLIDLIDGHLVPGISERQAADIAATFGQTGAPPRLQGSIDYDQWTVSGEFNAERPLFRFALDDAAGTQLYVSSTTGRPVQMTTARERFWNWAGAIPHWLYFAQLRRNVALWSQVIIWTSLAGCFLTLLGIYIGLRQFLQRPTARWSPHRGILLWHHVPGLIFGLFALTWVASGLISMNPWGFLDSESQQPAVAALAGAPTSGARVKESLRALASAPLPYGVASVSPAALWGKLYLVVTSAGGSRWRVDATGSPAPIGSADRMKIAQTLGGTQKDAVPELMTQGDAYYYSHRANPAPFPVYRIILNNEQRTRYYLDPVSGIPLESLDSNARWYRWLHQGLHTLDFSPVLRARPVWDLLMLSLLSGVTVVCVTGAYLGLRRCFRGKPSSKVMNSTDPERCPICGKPNQCGVRHVGGACWCLGQPIPDEVLAKIPAEMQDPACVCEACAFDRVNAKMVTSCDPVFPHRY